MQLISTTTPVLRDDVFTTEEQTALGGFLAGYSGLTRDAENSSMSASTLSTKPALFESGLAANTHRRAKHDSDPAWLLAIG